MKYYGEDNPVYSYDGMIPLERKIEGKKSFLWFFSFYLEKKKSEKSCNQVLVRIRKGSSQISNMNIGMRNDKC